MLEHVSYKVNSSGGNGEYLVVVFHIEMQLLLQIDSDI